LAPVSHRDRDDILGILNDPVPSPVPAPWRVGPAERAAGITAMALRETADMLQLVPAAWSPDSYGSDSGFRAG
jgi:hypothetical protein